jgi:hypothetical protein
MIRVVLDTNIVVSALLQPLGPGDIADTERGIPAMAPSARHPGKTKARASIRGTGFVQVSLT